MYIAFKYPCIIGVVLPEGDMTSMHVGLGEKYKVNYPAVVTLGRLPSHQDFELEDGTLLKNVPTDAIWMEHNGFEQAG